jgi:hypothetical protein
MLGLGAPACGDPEPGPPADPAEFAARLYDLLCDKLHACFGGQEDKQTFCPSLLKADCFDEGLYAERPYDPDIAYACLIQAEGLDCFLLPDGIVSQPACVAVLREPICPQ